MHSELQLKEFAATLHCQLEVIDPTETVQSARAGSRRLTPVSGLFPSGGLAMVVDYAAIDG